MPTELNIYDSAIEGIERGLEKGEEKGYSGWDDPEQCDEQVLRERLEFALEDADYQAVLTYAAMLHHRNKVPF